MDCRRSAGNLRRAGLRGVEFSHARVRRPYRYLREIYGPRGLGRLISFLFIWQLSFSAPLSIASGAIGLAGYASYFFPGLERQYAVHNGPGIFHCWARCKVAGWFPAQPLWQSAW